MTRSLTTVLLIIALLASTVAGGVGTVAAQEGGESATPTTSEQDETNSTDENGTTLAPGQQLAVVLSAQGTEVKTEVDAHAFANEMATSNNKAETASERAKAIRKRVQEHREQRDELIDEFRAGNLSKDEFLARLTRVNTKLDAATELATRAEAAAEKHGVNAAALAKLKADARNMTGPEVREVAHQLSASGRADVSVETDAEGNVHLRTRNGTTIGLDYRVQGSDNLTFDIARDNGTLVLTVMDVNGSAVQNATVTANGRPVGTTDASGQVSGDVDALFKRTGKSGKLVIAVTHGDDRAMVKLGVKNIPDEDEVSEWRRDHFNDRYEKAHERFHDRREAAHERFHDRYEGTREAAEERRKEAREEFEKRWEDRREKFEAKLEAQGNLSDERKAELEAEFEAEYDAALEAFKENHSVEDSNATKRFNHAHEKFHEKWDALHEKFHAKWEGKRPHPGAKKPPKAGNHPGADPRDGHDHGGETHKDRDSDDRPEAGAHTDGLTMNAVSDEGLLTVTVMTDDGRPAENATVELDGEVAGHTNANGVYEMEVTHAGTVEITVSYGEAVVKTEVFLELDGRARTGNGH